jgi:hypothetical protein
MRNDFLDKLRDDARQLRYEPEDDVLWTRLAARVRARLGGQPSVSQFLARWFRPVGVSLAGLGLVAALGIGWFETNDPAYTLEAMNAVEITIDGDTYNLAE